MSPLEDYPSIPLWMTTQNAAFSLNFSPVTEDSSAAMQDCYPLSHYVAPLVQYIYMECLLCVKVFIKPKLPPPSF